MTEEELRTIQERIEGYTKIDAVAQRDHLVALWKQHHPEAANETTETFHTLELLKRKKPGDAPDDPDQIWMSDQYNVAVRFRPDEMFRSREPMIQLGISNLNGSARHDWRHFQAIKNQLAGAECEGFELYPAESRLLDPSNYWSLFCFPGVKRLRVGQPFRRVLDQNEALAPQRALSSES